MVLDKILKFHNFSTDKSLIFSVFFITFEKKTLNVHQMSVLNGLKMERTDQGLIAMKKQHNDLHKFLNVLICERDPVERLSIRSIKDVTKQDASTKQ